MDIELKIEYIAEVCHEVNRGFCAAHNDFSQPAWNEAPEWQKQSARNGVRAALADPGRKPSDSHEGWAREKLADGWTWGPVKDPEKKLHPCLVSYEDLSQEQRAKDALFLAVVRALQ